MEQLFELILRMFDLREFLDRRFDNLYKRLDKQEQLLADLLRKENKQMSTIAEIEREVSEIGQVIPSAVKLMEQLSKLIRENANDPARLKKIAEELDANATRLATAVAANTPSGTPTPPPPPVE